MTSPSNKGDDGVGIAQQVLEGFLSNAQYMADLVGAFLEGHRLVPPPEQRRNQPVVLPAGFLLDLGAALRLACWEHEGLRDYLPADLPSAQPSLDRLLESLRTGQEDPETPSAALLRQVLLTWFTCFAWSCLEELGADVLLAQADDEQVLQQLADFLWRQRPTARPEE
jgi:hypothetical protein